MGHVRQALQKEGKDPNILDMDPEKSYVSQVKKDGDEKDAGPPLKDDPEFSKFFKVCIDFPVVYKLFLQCNSHINVLLRSFFIIIRCSR